MSTKLSYENSITGYCKANHREDLLEEWDYSENAGVTPVEVAHASNIKRFWRCYRGHKWMATPNARILRNHNCPYCSNRLVWQGFNDLETQNPLLANEWDYEKNSILPSQVMYQSSKKYWWKCSTCGNTWETSIEHRQKGTGCPYCSNRKIIGGFNDLETTHPEIVKEWDYNKNKDFSPKTVSYGSRKMVWWRCPKNHSYQALINNRICNGENCPYCSGKKVLSGFNDFETWCRDNKQDQLLKEWCYEKNNIKPNEITSHTHREVWWKCSSCGNEWKCSISSRTRNINVFGCKRCAIKSGNDVRIKNQAISGESLQDKYPSLIKEWDFEKNKEIKPEEVLCQSNKIAWWICPKGHSYNTPINRRTGRGTGCPICANREVLKGYNDLSTTNPDLVAEWDYRKNKLLPTEVVINGHQKIWWKCRECGYEWCAILSSRARGTGCPRCAREYSSSFPEQVLFYYLKSVYSDAVNGDRHLGLELDIYIPSERLAFEYDGAKWHKNVERDIKKNKICEKNGIQLFRLREKDCPVLPYSKNTTVILVEKNNEKQLKNAIDEVFRYFDKNVIVDIDKDRAQIYGQYRNALHEKSIEKTNPELLASWDYENNIIMPSHVHKGSHMKVWWVCPKGHHYQQSIHAKSVGIGCPICSSDQVLEGFNDFSSWCKLNGKEFLLLEWDYHKNDKRPTEITKSPKDMYWWICPRGHSYSSFVYNRIKGVGCPICAGKKTEKGFNDFVTEHPELEKEWDYIKNDKSPYEYTSGSCKKVYWICPKGHSYESSISHRTSGRGCPYCAGKKVVSGVDDFATMHPDLVIEWDYSKNSIDPTQIKSGSNKRVWWKCHICGHEWGTSVCNRTRQRTGCPICSRKKKDPHG